jgi:hypothetical protein
VGQTVRVNSRDRPPVLWPEVPPFMRDAPGPRPDGLQLDLQQLLGAGTENQTDSGLYVLVKEGRIVLVQEGKTLELDRGESAYASPDGTQLYRLRTPPTEVLRELVDPPAPRLDPGALICTF